MDNRRLFLLLALGLILMLLWTSWRSEHPPVPRPTAVQPSSAVSVEHPVRAGSQAPPVGSAIPPLSMKAANLMARASGPSIDIRTNVLDLKLALRGAAIVQAALLRYPKKEGGKQPVSLLSSEPKQFRVVSLDLDSDQLPAKLEYKAPQATYILAPGAQTLRVPLRWSGHGITVTRILYLRRSSYVVRVDTQIASPRKTISVRPGVSLAARNPPMAAHLWDRFLPKYWAYRGPAYFNGSYNKRTPESLPGNPIDTSFAGGWIGSVLQYFVAAAIPPRAQKARYFGQALGSKGYEIGYRLAPIRIAAGSRAQTKTSLFLGPKRQDMLGRIAPGLQRTVDYGKATIICVPIFWILSHIQGFLGNWGWSIILLVLLIKILFYWPQRISARSMAKMRKLQPRIKHLQERYKDDKQKLSQATMELYRKEGANPVSGCLPMLIQIPIFIGLFYVLIDSVELRQAPWVLWIHDLSAPDPLYVLPVLYGIISLVQFRLQPQAVDSAQAKMMMFMPLLFMFFYAIFPAGLVLYYLWNQFLNVAIQWQVNRELGIPMALGFSLRKKE